MALLCYSVAFEAGKNMHSLSPFRDLNTSEDNAPKKVDFLRSYKLSSYRLFKPNSFDIQLYVGGHSSIARLKSFRLNYLIGRPP
jgi:hypothetical protein